MGAEGKVNTGGIGGMKSDKRGETDEKEKEERIGRKR